MLTDRHAGAGGVEQADRFVGQLARGDIAVRKLHRGLQRFVEDLYLVMLLHHAGDATHHQDRLLLAGLVDLHGLKPAREGGVFLDVLFVLGKRRGADRAQSATGERGFQQVGGITGASRTTCTDQRMGLVDEQNDRLGRGLYFFNHLLQAVLELALHAGAGLQQAHVEHTQLHVFQRRRYVADRDTHREAFDHCGLADTRLADQHGVVLTATHQDVD